MRERDSVLLMEPGTIGWGGNSGFHALNLAVQFRASKIILVGYDMRIDMGLHWHGSHPRSLNNPLAKNIDRWRRAVDGAAPILYALGIKTVNVSPISTLQAYPKMSLTEALEC